MFVTGFTLIFDLLLFTAVSLPPNWLEILLLAVAREIAVLLEPLDHPFTGCLVYKDLAILLLTHIFSRTLLPNNQAVTPIGHPPNAAPKIAVWVSDNQNILLLSILFQAWSNHFFKAIPPAIFLLRSLMSTHISAPKSSNCFCIPNLIVSCALNILFLVGSYFKWLLYISYNDWSACSFIASVVADLLSFSRLSMILNWDCSSGNISSDLIWS